MGRQGSIFAFFSLSTIAIIMMQPGPRDDSASVLDRASEASRNNLTVLQPTPQKPPLPLPDPVVSQIKQAQQAVVAPVVSAPVQMASIAPQPPSPPVFSQAPVLAPEPPAPQLEPVPTPSFLASPAPQLPKPVQTASAPVRSDLRDMSWSALGTLQKLGHVSKAPGGEGSLINSIVRRSMAHVDDPAAASVVPSVPAAPAPVTVAASAPRLTAPQQTPAPSHIGKRGTYTVTSGDNLALIAVKLYGSALKTDQLLMDNPALRANPNALRIGQVISYRLQ